MCPPGLPELSDDECKVMFDMIDVDHSTKISKHEMVRFIKDCLDQDEADATKFKQKKKKE